MRRTSFSDHGVGWTRSHQLPPVRTSTRTYLRKTRDADQRFLSSHPPGQAEGALRPSRSFYNAEYLLLRAILRTPDVESYFMQCQGGDQGGEPVRDHGCDGTGAGADKTMLRGSPGSHFTSGSNRFRPCAGAAADVPGGALPVPLPPAVL